MAEEVGRAAPAAARPAAAIAEIYRFVRYGGLLPAPHRTPAPRAWSEARAALARPLVGGGNTEAYCVSCAVLRAACLPMSRAGAS